MSSVVVAVVAAAVVVGEMVEKDILESQVQQEGCFNRITSIIIILLLRPLT